MLVKAGLLTEPSEISKVEVITALPLTARLLRGIRPSV